MKKVFALLLGLSLLFLCACGGDEEQKNIKYVNIDEQSGIEKNYASGWEDYEIPTEDASSDSTQPAVDASELLPENFPEAPEGISDLTIQKMPYSEETGYPTEYVELSFICDYSSLVIFSQSLKDIGYKGGIKEITNGTYYPTGIHGAWQDGNYLIRIVGTEAIIDGSHDVTMHIVPCVDVFPEELAALSSSFNGYCGAEPFYYEYVDGEAVLRDFDGNFHAKWMISFTNDCSYVGVTREDYENYFAELESKGYTIGGIEPGTLDSCNTFLGEAISSNESVYIMLLYNESLATLDIYYTNDFEGMEISADDE